MENELRDNTILYFTIPTILLVASASLGGLLFGSTYARETSAWVAQALGQDLVNLILIVPTLVVSSLLVRSGKRSALFVWLGTMVYTAYTFVVYSFGVHFNTFFLVYCWTLGLSVYAVITLTVRITPAVVKRWFDETRHEYSTSIFVLAAGVVFYLMWLKEDLPAMISDQTPPGLQATGLLTNPIHVLDLSIVLPGFIITSILLVKKHAFGYLFAPVLLVFAALMCLTIAVLIAMMDFKEATGNLVAAGLFLVVTLVCLGLLVIFLRHMRNPAV